MPELWRAVITVHLYTCWHRSSEKFSIRPNVIHWANDRRSIEARFTCLFFHSLSKPCCPWPSPSVALEHWVPQGEIYVEVRKHDRWGRLPEHPLLGCTSMFAFLGPQLDKGSHWKLCCCSEYQGVMAGTWLGKGTWELTDRSLFWMVCPCPNLCV